MLQVSTTNLSPDCSAADPACGTRDLGPLAPEALAGLLEKFRGLDALQNHEHEPFLTVQAPTGKFLIRTGGGRLLLYNARDTTQPSAELAIPALLEALGAAPAPPAPSADEFLAPIPPVGPDRPPQTLLAVALFAAALILVGWSVYAYISGDPEPAAPACIPVTDETAVARYREQLAGAYATGNEPGDRIIIVAADGTIKFQQLNAGNAPDETSDTCAIGRRDQSLCLMTKNSGVVAVQPDDSLLYFGDTYRRLGK